ncbi:slipin family protein [Brevibacterium sediminis]|uniref:slipin family protein n=1 Tax=Brevibacterium sediminis TaxID=1857024 RepID=UPI002174E5CA|nr:slipin family protein [Brevibacterium sediminis]MCS4594357.1 slipin family protein [Brevibacterium sediminis]
MLALSILAALVALGAITLGNSLKIVKQYERGVVYRLGRVNAEPRPPGMTAIVPFVDKLEKVNLQIVTMPIPAQEGITRDNVTVRVDAVIYFKVVDPRKAVVDVEDYQLAVGQVAQTSLRSIIGQSELDDLLTNRERLNQGLAIMIDSPAVDWGVHIDRVEIKDVALPESMKRSMSRQAEAERERRSRVIIADGELQASNKLAKASEAMAHTPSALQLRLLQTIVEVAAERNSTLVLPFPVELLRFLENNTPTAPTTTEAGAKSTTEAGVTPTTDTPAEAADRSGSDTTSSAPADLDAIVQAMSESLKLTGLMPEQERVTSDMPEQERTTSDSAARSDSTDQEEHLGHA